jgi:hypothetical protein
MPQAPWVRSAWVPQLPQPLGTAHGRFQRAIQRRNLFQAELAIREMGTLNLLDALAYLDLLAEVRPEKVERAAVRWHGRLETEAATLTMSESQLALAALASLCAGEREAIKVLRPLVRRARPTLLPRSLDGTHACCGKSERASFVLCA